MAVIPKYFSESQVAPAVNQVKMDPNVAAAPYRAAEQSTAHVLNSVQQELGAWHGLLRAKEQEQKATEQKQARINDSLYSAQSNAQLSMASGDIARKALSQGGDVKGSVGIADAEFQKLADSILANAPSQESRMQLTKRLITARAGLYNHVNDTAIKQNNQMNMDKMENSLGQYEAYAATNPESVNELKAQSADIFKAMEDLGIPSSQRELISSKFNRNLDFQAAKSLVEKDPFGMQERVMSGEFSHLGAKASAQLNSTLKASVGAATKQAKQALNDVEKRVMLGQPLPQDFESRAQLAAKAGLTEDLQDIVRLTDVSKMASDATLTDMMGVSAELKGLAARGEIDGNPNKIKKLIKYVDTSIKAMKEDPFSFAENKGKFTPFNTITDFTSVNEEEAQKRSYRALQIQEAYGVTSPALKQSELKLAAQQLEALPGPERMKVIDSISKFGPSTVEAFSKVVGANSGGLNQAVRMHGIDPDITNKILLGRDLLATKTVSKTPHKEFVEEGTSSLEGLATEDPNLKKDMLEAGQAYLAHEESKGSSIGVKEALMKANNVISVDRNGLFTGSYKTVAPGPNMTTRELDKLVDTGLSGVNDWKKYSTGEPVRTEKGLPLPKINPSDFDYVATKTGKYGVMHEGNRVLDADGNPVYVDLKQLYKDNH